MSGKERTRYHLMELVEEGRITLKEASIKMDLSYRQAKRVRKKFKDYGAKGLIHGNRGHPSGRALDSGLRDRILELSRARYELFNDSHFTEKLEEEEGIKVCRETVRRLRRSAGIKPQIK